MRLSFLTLVFAMFSALGWAEGTSFHLAMTPAFRLSCLPGQNFATLESLWLQRLPDKDLDVFRQTLAQQGIYMPLPLHKAEENLPLQASCSVEGHAINVQMTGNGDITKDAIQANEGKDFTYVDCSQVMNLILKTLDVDGTSWYSKAAFADACLAPSILRMRIYPQEHRLQVCTQDLGGLLEDGLPDVWYSDLPVTAEMRENPPTPKVTCKTINIPDSSKQKAKTPARSG